MELRRDMGFLEHIGAAGVRLRSPPRRLNFGDNRAAFIGAGRSRRPNGIRRVHCGRHTGNPSSTRIGLAIASVERKMLAESVMPSASIGLRFFQPASYSGMATDLSFRLQAG